jgi:hypothetical protein
VHVDDILRRVNAQGFAKVKFRAQRANRVEFPPVLKLIIDNIHSLRNQISVPQ